jgi:hypothetical protein
LLGEFLQLLAELALKIWGDVGRTPSSVETEKPSSLPPIKGLEFELDLRGVARELMWS